MSYVLSFDKLIFCDNPSISATLGCFLSKFIRKFSTPTITSVFSVLIYPLNNGFCFNPSMRDFQVKDSSSIFILLSKLIEASSGIVKDIPDSFKH